jgi:hypothetical protein
MPLIRKVSAKNTPVNTEIAQKKTRACVCK